MSRGPKDISLEPFQARYHDLIGQGVQIQVMAERAGMYSGGYADGGQLLRALGLKHYVSRGRRFTKTHTNHRMAGRLCRALDIDPVDLDI